MKYEFETKDELIKFLASEVLTTPEARELLDCSRQYLSQLVSKGKIIPIKVLSRESLFFKEDLETLKNKKNKIKEEQSI
ncbi:helix-turn-helix domain-containing protein [Clostridium estertheticum]|uniref:helix-turn-helix domain-containing protein n=1 Tax=Clostridium estertheticum TaxID=238834 RepID=UPI00124C5765|nr:helix-turn-helix domain-containing protein [Clostridium estertheticum]MBZ9615273.1 helix-turn-helix domain-containing protein [Clostridium estertheticum subsp. laramiense]WAG75162.1 helix-turn-helix domain-containing protein [Clostridium estertheticum]